MTKRSAHGLEAELLGHIGEEAFIRLAEAFGGTRVSIPRADRLGPDHDLVHAVGHEAAVALSKPYAGIYIRVPLARERLARHYRLHGMSNAKIARKLRITETGVDKLFGRMPDKPAKGGEQLDLFA